MTRWIAAFAAALALAGTARAQEAGLPAPALAPGVSAEDVAARVRQFAPVELAFDAALLSPSDRALVRALVEASDALHEVFRSQVWRGNPAYGEALAASSDPELEAAREYYAIMAGPWDRLAADEPFLDVGAKPAGAGYYPEDATREEIERWVSTHPEDERGFTSYYTLIGRTKDRLVAVPYHVAYAEPLERAAGLLRAAAELADNASLKEFLELRARSLLSDDYFDSEVAWMRLSGNLVDPTLGPYEVYEDGLMGWKAAYEAFIGIRDPGASADLAVLVEHLPDLEAALPIDEAFKSPDRSFASPLSVVDLIYAAGDARRGVMTLAFNLPNDPRVSEQHGTKKVMLRNVIDAKFENVLVPIAERVLEPALAAEIEARPFTTLVVMHELAHGLGPRLVHGTEEPVSVRLAADYSAIEEAKADVVGVLSLAHLADAGVYTPEFRRQVYIGSVAGLFRCVRFGTEEAHGKGCSLQLRHLMDARAITPGTDGRFGIDFERIHGAYEELARALLTIEATGDAPRARTLLADAGELPTEAGALIAGLADVPVDIRPIYPVVEAMREW